MSDEQLRRIQDVFQAALAREGEERAAFLDGACLGDRDLRKKVDSFIASHEQAESFPEKPDAQTLEKCATGASDDTPTVARDRNAEVDPVGERLVAPIGSFAK